MAAKDVKVKPLFITTRDLPFDDISTREICSVAEKTTGYDTMEGAQRIGGLWRIYPKTHAARLQLQIGGLSLRNIHVKFLDENPFLVRSSLSDGTKVETTKLFISNLPISFANSEIEGKLINLGCKPVSKMIDECDRDENGKLTRWKTGRGFIFIAVPSLPLPSQISVGMFSARLFHKEQKNQAAFCTNCLQNGHRKQECEAEIVCRLCKKSGHKRGDALCEPTTGQREIINGSDTEDENEAGSADDESSSNEASQIKLDKEEKKEKINKLKRKEREEKSGGSSADEDQRNKIPNHNSSPMVGDKRPSDTDCSNVNKHGV